ncbi:kinesin-like protein KIN-5C [Silene latifolia]|uniref:kinesin-like protein KIN-5C n=1 Tax=Silene latifolia TaxID=37657 RepID=UPI003D7788BA
MNEDLQLTLTVPSGGNDSRQRFHDSIEHMKDTSEFINEYLIKIREESSKLSAHASQMEETQIKCISEFQNVFKERSKIDFEKLIANMTDLVTRLT